MQRSSSTGGRSLGHRHGELLYLAVASGSSLLGILGSVLGWWPGQTLPWLMLFTAVIASFQGFVLGITTAGMSILILNLLRELTLMNAIILVFSAVIAHSIGESLRAAHRRSRALAKGHRLVAEALQALTLIEHRDRLLKSLPERLASLGEGGHIGVWIPTGSGFRCLICIPPISFEEVPDVGVMGRAMREGRPQYISDVRKEPSHIAAPGFKTLAELAMPLFERGEVVAVLNIERRRGFLPEEIDGLVRFAETVSLQLDRLADLEARRLITDLAIALQQSQTLQEAAEMALALLVRTTQEQSNRKEDLQRFALDAGVLWEARGAHMQALGYQGVTEPQLLQVLQEGLPYGQGIAWEVYRSGMPFYTSTYAYEPKGVPALQSLDWRTLVAHPIPTPDAKRSRFILVVGERTRRPWRRAEQELLSLFCRTLGVGFERLVEKTRHERVNRLVQDLLDAPSSGLYDRVLQEAIQMVPGSEAGSLMVLEEMHYHYKAVVGFDSEGLKSVTTDTDGMLHWYGLGKEHAEKGEPRLITIKEQPIPEVSYQTAPAEVMDLAGRLREIQANLCLPFSYRGEVLAYLNLDNLHDPDAFGEDSLRAARFFAAPLATILHEIRTHRLLKEAALTDALTGLPNRRAFDQILLEELKRASRYPTTFSLAIMDLKGFKTINDCLGHAAGDQALIRVARALNRELRSGDHLFRWGGDEFAAIILNSGKADARIAASRYVHAIESIRFGELDLSVSIGLAAYPEDGETPDELLNAADTRMYSAKISGVKVI